MNLYDSKIENSYNIYRDQYLIIFFSSNYADNLFGVDIETVVNRECESISVSMQQIPQSPLVVSVPIIIRRCIEEIEKRGLDIIGRKNIIVK